MLPLRTGLLDRKQFSRLLLLVNTVQKLFIVLVMTEDLEKGDHFRGDGDVPVISHE